MRACMRRMLLKLSRKKQWKLISLASVGETVAKNSTIKRSENMEQRIIRSSAHLQAMWQKCLHMERNIFSFLPEFLRSSTMFNSFLEDLLPSCFSQCLHAFILFLFLQHLLLRIEIGLLQHVKEEILSL